jgi:hypothetical protein
MRTRIALAVLALALAVNARAEIVITLKNSTIMKYRNRATVSGEYRVVHAHKKVNPVAKDADIHVAGFGTDIGLPAVAEVMNAASSKEAVDRIHAVEGKTTALQITGAWRLWCEHGGSAAQVDGAAIPPIKDTNPPHVFEIHPLTRIDAIKLEATLHPIGSAFKPKDARDAFLNYEGLSCQIAPGKDTTRITTNMAGFNYVEFQLRLNGKPVEVTEGGQSQGIFALAKVETTDGELLVHNRRMVFIPGTSPADDVVKMQPGACMHVLGVPRINLALVAWRMQHAKTRPEALNWSLPYEIVIVGEYPGGCAESEE